MRDKLKTVSQYETAIKNLNKARELKDKKSEVFNKEARKVRDYYYDKKREIESRERAEINKIYEAEKVEEEKLNVVVETTKETRNEFDKILNIKHYFSNDVEKNLECGIYTWEYPKREDGSNDYSKEKFKQYLEPEEILVDDEYSKIKVYIAKNDRSVNQYTLCIIGKTALINANNNAYKYFGGYLSGIREENANIEVEVKVGRTVKELREYWVRNKEKKINALMNNIIEDTALFNQVKEECNTREWEIAYLESRKYYYENNYSHGTEQPEYKEILKKLEELRE